MKKILLGLLLITLCGCNAVINDNSNNKNEYDLSFNEKDLDFSYSSDDAQYIELSDENLYIKNAGTYILTGKMNDASVIIETPKDEKVKLVLDNVTINSNDFASIYVVESDKVTITSAEGSVNTLSNSSVYKQIDDNNVDAVIYSKADLVFNGSGKLIVNSDIKHGIVSKDDIVIAGGTYEINTASQGINGKDSVKIYDGTINITSGGDSIKSNNDEDDYRGFVYIKDGDININSSDDAIQAITLLQIDGGNVNINDSYEGLEGQYIVINGGNVLINATDDGINACDKKGDSKQETPSNGKRGFNFGSTDAGLIINGGYTYICASGDGIDSNGTIALYSGSLIIDGPVSDGDQAFDYETGGYAYGSETLCVGSSGMAESFSNDSTQFNLLYNLDTRYKENTKIIISIDDEVLFEHTSAKSFNSLLFTSSKIKQGDTVTITIGDDTYTYTFDQITNSNGRGGMNQGGMPNMGDRDPDNKEMPEGMDKPENMPNNFNPGNMEPPGEMPGGMDKPEGFDPNNRK